MPLINYLKHLGILISKIFFFLTIGNKLKERNCFFRYIFIFFNHNTILQLSSSEIDNQSRNLSTILDIKIIPKALKVINA